MNAHLVYGTRMVSTNMTSRPELDRVLAELRANKLRWANCPIDERVNLIDEMLRGVRRVDREWVHLSHEAKGIDPSSATAAEEWLAGPYLVARNLRLLRRSLIEIGTKGRPQLPGPVRVENKRVIAQVFPTDVYDRIMFRGYRADVWMQPQVTLESLPKTMAVAYHQPDPVAKVCLVLGGGNVSSIAPMDAFYKLFVEVAVVALKLHPELQYLRSILKEVLQPVIDWGALRIVEGAGDEGTYLVHHSDVDEVHLTGSIVTHDAIVFGTDSEAAWRKDQRKPLLQKRITSELGNVSAMIIAPGNWRKSDLKIQAENIVSSVINNAGFNCNATRVLVTHRQWPQRDELLDAIRQILVSVPPRKAYYPGARDRFELFLDQHPEAERFGVADGDEKLPWAFVTGLDPTRSDDICFRTESFCSLFCETALDAPDESAFMDAAVDFVNGVVWGSLNASLVIPPQVQRQSEMKRAVARAIEELRVGTIGVNHWPAVGYGMCSTTWGAFPGHSLEDIQSGQGVVHNTYMFGLPEKSVIYGPFHPWPKPIWFLSHRRSREIAEKLVNFECNPSMMQLPNIIRLAFEI